MPADYTAGDPIPRRHYGRQVGESYRDALDRLAGQLRAAEQERDQARARIDAVLAVAARFDELDEEGDEVSMAGAASRVRRALEVTTDAD